jgi:hypothetical protein
MAVTAAERGDMARADDDALTASDRAVLSAQARSARPTALHALAATDAPGASGAPSAC